ncbi:hypothetical protein FB45DRAFT_915944 [Roridomyces roridus]|uniref:F-box domain-containing protein n=1 Tax=Roridomyces roridus TaxID=1738132 RepID=A0AAD7BTR3_9AGAR|nr:hypothetical protein FB45DRAFT_915944 [Roridomyces roridus]
MDDTPPALFMLPHELLEFILLFCHPRDIAHFAMTCRSAETLVYGSVDLYFWRQLFLNYFDDPRLQLPHPVDGAFDWKGQLIRRMKAERVVFTGGDRQSALETLLSIAGEALPSSIVIQRSRNVDWLHHVLSTSAVLDASFAPNEARFGDRLKAYMGLSLTPDTEDNLEQLRTTRTHSRCAVYDLRNYHRGNRWGPYMTDGSINWSRVEQLINVVETNLREQQIEHPSIPFPRPPVGLQAIRPHSAPGDFSGADWAGVEGTWRRYVCFMDYRDQFSDAVGGARDPSFFDDIEFHEATRLIELQLHLIPREKMRIKFPTGDPPANPHKDYPTLYISGTSRGASTQEAMVQGFVYMGEDFVPRWRFTSIHDGHPQWSSEGVQIGGIGSAMGVSGTWSAFHHGEGKPYWLWKVAAL